MWQNIIMVISNEHFNGSNTHSVNETIRLMDIKKICKSNNCISMRWVTGFKTKIERKKK